jgi:transcriptional regulator with XRE-family HTH domain
MGARKSTKNDIGNALKIARKSKSLSQEEFSDISSRTYISVVERGLKSPTLGKVDAIAERMGLHPLTLLTLAYCANHREQDLLKLQRTIDAELNGIWQQ